jgi:hypothetical protein
MRNIAILGERARQQMPDSPSIGMAEIDGFQVRCGLMITPSIPFDRDRPENEFNVLVKTKAFSCNYRDRGWISFAAQKSLADSFFVIGSEFAGEVFEVGTGVTDFKIGDRAIGNNRYTGRANGAEICRGSPVTTLPESCRCFARPGRSKSPLKCPMRSRPPSGLTHKRLTA